MKKKKNSVQEQRQILKVFMKEPEVKDKEDMKKVSMKKCL